MEIEKFEQILQEFGFAKVDEKEYLGTKNTYFRKDYEIIEVERPTGHISFSSNSFYHFENVDHLHLRLKLIDIAKIESRKTGFVISLNKEEYDEFV